MKLGKHNINEIRSVHVHDVMFYKFGPGSCVRHIDHEKSFGTIISRTPKTVRKLSGDYETEEVTVLWSRWPAVEPFTRVKFPTVQRVNPVTFASEIVKVQPITGPSGDIFFHREYVYGDKK